MMEREVSSKRVAANQANCQKSTGPKTPEGKARVSLNALKTGAYAKTDNALREIMLRRGEDPADYEQLHRELTEGWRPDDVMQEMSVKTIADKSWERAQLRAAWMESQLLSLQVGQIQAKRKQLLARRWLPGTAPAEPSAQGLWLEKDRPNKFKRMFDLLDLLQKWFEDGECPDEYPQVMRELYGECHSLAGEKIRTLFIQLFDTDDKAAEAAQELPKWIDQERRDVEEERDLYQREMTLRAKAGPNLTEEQMAGRESALGREIREETRLLLQLKAKRAQWGSKEQGIGNREQGIGSTEQGTGNREQGTDHATGPADATPALRPVSSPSSGPSAGQSSGPANGPSAEAATKGPANGPSADETVVSGAAIVEKSDLEANKANQVI